MTFLKKTEILLPSTELLHDLQRVCLKTVIKKKIFSVAGNYYFKTKWNKPSLFFAVERYFSASVTERDFNHGVLKHRPVLHFLLSIGGIKSADHPRRAWVNANTRLIVFSGWPSRSIRATLCYARPRRGDTRGANTQ